MNDKNLDGEWYWASQYPVTEDGLNAAYDDRGKFTGSYKRPVRIRNSHTNEIL